MSHLNRQPLHSEVTNELYSIRPHYLEGRAKFYRQTIVHSEMMFNELKVLRTRHLHNYKGTLQIKPLYPDPLGDVGKRGRGILKL